jgi:hypothetical protein
MVGGSIQDQSIDGASSFNITRLPLLLLMGFQEFVFLKGLDNREERKKGSHSNSNLKEIKVYQFVCLVPNKIVDKILLVGEELAP